MKNLIILLLASSNVFANNYYFAANGNNSNPGSIGSPFQTLTKLNSLTLNPGDTVLFKRGDVFYGTIPCLYSGRALSKIVYSAYGTGAMPVITGLTALSGWTNSGGNLWSVTLSPAPTNTLNLVTIADTFQRIGRYPKANLGDASYYNIDGITNDPHIITNHLLHTNPNTYIGGEIVHKTQQWVIDRGDITAQSYDNVTYTPQVYTGGGKPYPDKLHYGFFFQNHVNTCTVNGEWAYNKSTKVLTMFLTSDPNAANIKAATIDSLVAIDNKNYITFQNLHFRGSNSQIFRLNQVVGLKLYNDSIELSQDGIQVYRLGSFARTNHDTISNCAIFAMTNNGLTLQASNWQINNNHIYRIAQYVGMGRGGDGQYGGIAQVGARSVVELNEIDSIGYSGIWFIGDSVTIRKNHIHHCVMTKSDGGGIYTYGPIGTIQRKVYLNIVHDCYSDPYGKGDTLHTNPYNLQANGIYNDDKSSNITDSLNTVFNCGQAGIWLGSNTNITVVGNTLYNNTTAQIKGTDRNGSYSGVVIKNNLLIAKDSGQLCLSLPLGAGVGNFNSSMAGITLDNNVYSRPIWQPSNIDSSNGYPSPISFSTYHNGAVIQNPKADGPRSNNSFYSLDKWQARKGKDLNTNKHKGTVRRTSDIFFQYNPTASPITIALSENYYDINGRHRYTGTVTIQPYSSLLLLKAE